MNKNKTSKTGNYNSTNLFHWAKVSRLCTRLLKSEKKYSFLILQEEHSIAWRKNMFYYVYSFTMCLFVATKTDSFYSNLSSCQNHFACGLITYVTDTWNIMCLLGICR